MCYKYCAKKNVFGTCKDFKWIIEDISKPEIRKKFNDALFKTMLDPMVVQ